MSQIYRTITGPIPPVIGTVVSLTTEDAVVVHPDAGGNINIVGSGVNVSTTGDDTSHTVTITWFQNLTVTGNSGGPVSPSVGDNLDLVGDGITLNVVGTPLSNKLTFSATGIGFTNVTAVNHAASPYTATATDSYLSCDVTAGVITIRLPNAPVTGRSFTIKDKVGLAAASNITVTTVGGVVNIDGSTSFVMNTAYEAVSVIFNGVSYEVF